MKALKSEFRKIFVFILAGISVGIIITLFKMTIPIVKKFSIGILKESRIEFLILYFAIWAAISVFIKLEKNIKGSGVSDVIKIYNGELSTKWYRVIFYKFLASAISIGSGLTIGIEGPSVQISGAVGEGAGKLLSEDADKKNALIGSAAAGMAVAFNAPLAAILFSIEKFYKKLDFKKITSASVIIFSAVIISNLITPQAAEISVSVIPKVSAFQLIYFLILGIFAGLSGRFINYSISNAQKFYSKLKMQEFFKYLIPFVITAGFLFLDSRLFGSGDYFFETDEVLNLKDFWYFYILKIFLLVIAISSGVPGGIFVPLLAIGFLFGQIFGNIFLNLGLISEDYIIVFILASMCAHFSAMIKTPLTGVVLIYEITGGKIEYILPFVIVSTVSYYISEIK